tara:strand:+ start:222 stop:737 length:516 start_codon:yes stop_codon:yes gene_type:complete
MNIVTSKSEIKLHFRGRSSDGSTFVDTWASKALYGESVGKPEPFKVVLGNGILLASLEKALVGMTEGEKKNVNLSAEEAHGRRRPDAIFPVDRKLFPEELQLQCGMPVTGKNAETGDMVPAVVLAFDDESVVLDHNHPLCEQALNFEIEIVEIEEVSAETTEEGGIDRNSQ